MAKKTDKTDKPEVEKEVEADSPRAPKTPKLEVTNGSRRPSKKFVMQKPKAVSKDVQGNTIEDR